MPPRTLAIGPKLKLPAHEAQTETIVVYGGKGMGKTNFGAVLAEELDRHELRFSWLDPVGVAWGLKHSADGKGDGIEVLVLGGAHGDIPIEPTAGTVVADLVVDEDVSVIIDISRHSDGRMWTQGEKIRFVRDYFIRLFQRQGEERRPLMQIVDEAGRFVPQDIPKGALDISECVGAIEQTVELGRNVGIGVTLITQRSARMKKSVSELAEMMVAFRTVGPRSMDAIVAWFAEHKRVVKTELEQQLRALRRGTALVVSPGWLGIEGEFAVRQRETFDSSDTPRAGQERKPKGKGATPDLGKYRERMEETIEKAERADPKKLEKKLAAAEKAAADGQRREAKLAEDYAKLETHAAELRDVASTVEPDRIEIPVIREEDLAALDRTLAPLLDMIDGFGTGMGEVGKILAEIRTRAAQPAVETRRESMSEALARADRSAPPVRKIKTMEPATRETVMRNAGPRSRADTNGHEERAVSGGAPSKILAVLAQYPVGRTKSQLAILTGYKKGGSTMRNALSSLRQSGLAEGYGDFIKATAEGLAAAGEVETVPTGGELYRYWMNRLGDSAPGVVLRTLYDSPDPLTREEIAERTGYTDGGSTLRNALSKLRKLQLIEGKGGAPLQLTPEFAEALLA